MKFPIFVVTVLYAHNAKCASDADYKLSTINNLFKDDPPAECTELLDSFAECASNFTRCSVKYARPVKLCEECVDQYVSFTNKYEQLLNTVVNGTSCRSIFLSHDRLDVVLGYHDNILSIWDKGNCNECYNWTESTPVLSKKTIQFKKMLNETVTCITTTDPIGNNSDEVCARCMQSYEQLDQFYRSLSKDSIGLETVCFDILDSMNTTRAIWSKELNCCKRLRSPETIFLCCTGIISFLPVLFYVMVRYFSPLRELPRALKESRFKQSFLRSSNEGTN